MLSVLREYDEVSGVNSNEKMKKNFENILRNDPIQQSESNSRGDEDDNISTISDQSTDPKSSRKRMQKMVNELNALHNVRETGMKKNRKKNTPRNLDDESLIVVSPQYYDEYGKFRGPGVKRSKHAVPIEKLKKTVHKLARKKTIHEAPKRQNARKVEKPKTGIKKKKNPVKSASTWRQVVINRITSKGKIKKVKTDLIKDNLRHQIVSAKARHGAGLEKEFIPYTDNITYEYYDDPNELCERLMLLASSKNAGNSNHSQEINSIIEELREQNVIV